MSAANPPRPGRNQPCHCGSGRKYKQCCLAKDEATAAKVRAKADAATEKGPEAAPPPTHPPKPQTHQPWKGTTSRGFVPRTRMPRKVGGS